jgi:hypothetical protein
VNYSYLSTYDLHATYALFLMPVQIHYALQRTNTEKLETTKTLSEKELRGHSPNFHIHVSVSDLYIPTIDLPILLQEICGPILGIYKSPTDT